MRFTNFKTQIDMELKFQVKRHIFLDFLDALEMGISFQQMLHINQPVSLLVNDFT